MPTPSELGSWRLWRHLRRLRLAAHAGSSVVLSQEECDKAWQDFCRRSGLDPADKKKVPRDFAPCTHEELREVIVRDLRISRWKEEVFGPHAKELFDKRKPDLDQVVYSLLRVRDLGLARELWFRLKENEATFAELAARYTEGHELHTSGIVGPSAFGKMHPALASLLRAGEEGKLLQPASVGDIFVVARVEKFLPVEFDAAMKARMVEELSLQWLESKLDEDGAE